MGLGSSWCGGFYALWSLDILSGHRRGRPRGAYRGVSGIWAQDQGLSCWKRRAADAAASTPFSGCSFSLLMCHSPDASHIIMADVLPNEALSRILAPSSSRLPFGICALSWLSGHACILFFMHYHVTVWQGVLACLLLLWRLRRLSLLFMLYLYLYALPGCKQRRPYHTAYASSQGVARTSYDFCDFCDQPPLILIVMLMAYDI